MKLDNLDLTILKNLQENGRMSFRELGRKLDVPHTTVFTRVERLKKKGVIKKFAALLHPHELGGQINLIVLDAPPSESKGIAKKIAELDEAKKVFRTYDGKVIIKAVVPSNSPEKGLEDFLTKLDGHHFTLYTINDIVKFDHIVHEDILK
ncbi:MAG: Lrp/AsnC family transcriptional regulator [Candidatus Altiarchaeota archaeon]